MLPTTVEFDFQTLFSKFCVMKTIMASATSDDMPIEALQKDKIVNLEWEAKRLRSLLAEKERELVWLFLL